MTSGIAIYLQKVIEAIRSGRDGKIESSISHVDAWKCIRIVLEGWQKNFYDDWIHDEGFLKDLLREIVFHADRISGNLGHILE
jgi:hypothetical protein